MPLSVVGAGFGRTGTLSLKNALEQLGVGRCYHMFEVYPPQVPLWQRAWDESAGTQFPWEDIFDGYACAVDWPACQFWRVLLDAYPESKCVLTVRDPSNWYDSVRKTIYEGSKRMRGLDDPVMQARTRMVYSIIWDGVFEGRFEDREFAIEQYELHIESVVDSVPRERLLVFDVRDGWRPLCDFLAVDVPDEPFPRTNSSDDFVRFLSSN